MFIEMIYVEEPEFIKPIKQKKSKMHFSGKPSKKKKNTYTIDFNGRPHRVSTGQKTSMIVATKNGKRYQPDAAFVIGTGFANPGANNMINLHRNNPQWREIMGTKLSCTIVEYLDKDTHAPVLLLFPQNEIVSLVPNVNWETVVATRLNRDSRRDLKYQMQKVRGPKNKLFQKMVHTK